MTNNLYKLVVPPFTLYLNVENAPNNSRPEPEIAGRIDPLNIEWRKHGSHHPIVYTI